MKIIEIQEKEIPTILEFEAENAPEKPFYVKYSKEELEFLFENPNRCAVFGTFENGKMKGWVLIEAKMIKITKYAQSWLAGRKEVRGLARTYLGM